MVARMHRSLLRRAGGSIFRVLDLLLPHARWADAIICRIRFWRANGRPPRAVNDPRAGFNDLIFARMAADDWTVLERAAIDKHYAKLIAMALCPAVKTSRTLGILPVASATDVAQAEQCLMALQGEEVVAKPTHASGAVMFMRDHPVDETIHRFCARAARSYNHLSRESQYRGLERRIILEEDLSREDAAPVDYKFFCSFGEVLFCQIDIDRFSRHRRVLVGPDFTWIKVRFSHDLPDAMPERPGNFDEMVRIAGQLSRPFRFARIDLYTVGGEVYFGEFTFAPEGGTGVLSNERFGIEVMGAVRGKEAQRG